MRKLPIFVGMVTGLLLGFITTISDGIGVRAVLMLIGALAGLAVGMGIYRMRTGSAEKKLRRDTVIGGGLLPEERIATYWRDKGSIYPMPGHPDPEGATKDSGDLT